MLRDRYLITYATSGLFAFPCTNHIHCKGCSSSSTDVEIIMCYCCTLAQLGSAHGTMDVFLTVGGETHCCLIMWPQRIGWGRSRPVQNERMNCRAHGIQRSYITGSWKGFATDLFQVQCFCSVVWIKLKCVYTSSLCLYPFLTTWCQLWSDTLNNQYPEVLQHGLLGNGQLFSQFWLWTSLVSQPVQWDGLLNQKKRKKKNVPRAEEFQQ